MMMLMILMREIARRFSFWQWDEEKCRGVATCKADVVADLEVQEGSKFCELVWPAWSLARGDPALA